MSAVVCWILRTNMCPFIVPSQSQLLELEYFKFKLPNDYLFWPSGYNDFISSGEGKRSVRKIFSFHDDGLYILRCGDSHCLHNEYVNVTSFREITKSSEKYYPLWIISLCEGCNDNSWMTLIEHPEVLGILMAQNPFNYSLNLTRNSETSIDMTH